MKTRHHPFCARRDQHKPGDCPDPLPVDEYYGVPGPGEVAIVLPKVAYQGPSHSDVILVLAGSYKEYEHFCNRMGIPSQGHTRIQYLSEPDGIHIMRGLRYFTLVLTGMWRARRDAFEIKDLAILMGAKVLELP